MFIFKTSPHGYKGFNFLPSWLKAIRSKFSRSLDGAYGASDSDIAEHRQPSSQQ